MLTHRQTPFAHPGLLVAVFATIVAALAAVALLMTGAAAAAGARGSTAPLSVTDTTLAWNTFLGASSEDFATALAVDAGGNIYVAGDSVGSWGSPVRAHADSRDAFVAKLSPSGALLWNTFLGGDYSDKASALALDGDGNVYVTGTSDDTWGSPVSDFAGSSDAFVAKLGPSGALLWNTFLGCSDWDYGWAMALDGSGNPCVAGKSDATWGSPVRAFGALDDAFVAKLTPSGALTWNTFLGGSDNDDVRALAVGAGGAIYVGGQSWVTWGTPVRGHGPGYLPDALVAGLTSSGALSWHTFLGGASDDRCFGLALTGSGDVCVSGTSYATWGTPVRPYTALRDGFAAKLTSSGALTWNTFVGGDDDDPSYGNALAVDGDGNLYLAGESYTTWGTPDRPHVGDWDAYVTQIGPAGALGWNTFLGGGARDYGYAVAVAGDHLLVAGGSVSTWGTPVRAYTAGDDAFVAWLGPSPDMMAPSVVASGANDGGWYRTDVAVSLTATDEAGGSGVASITYALDGVQTTVAGGSAVVNVPVLPNGPHTLVYRASDAAGNTSADASLSFTCDSTGPATAGRAASGRKGRAIALRYRITDDLSPRATGIRVVVKNSRGKAVKTFRPTARKTAVWYTVKWTPKARGTYRYSIYAKDLAGNAQRARGVAKVVVR